MDHTSGEVDAPEQVVEGKEIAIVGMACRFPGAAHYDAFWELLAEDRSSVNEIPHDRWDWTSYWGDTHGEGNTSYSKWGGFIDDVDAFDPQFFGLSAREAETMDPQQRIMLELAWNSFEDAGITPSRLSGSNVGVYIGVFNYDYKELQEHPSLVIQTYHSTGTASAVIANRISYFFNFKGPSLPIDTACSSSLNAIHAAVQSLQAGECKVALAGGVNLLLTPTRHISFAKTGMLSPTGSCKTFDDSADGYVRSEGAGMVVLKPLAQALADGDRIYGIVKGSAINHNGKTHTLTYPNPEAQAEVICEAYRRAGVSPLSVSYIEAHGTGTPKGDPLEFQGLCTAFQQLATEEGAVLKKGYCGLGAVKSNIGHLEAAAGMAGVMKTLLAFKHKQLPKLHHFQRLNHRIKLRHTPFYMLDTHKPWKALRDNEGNALPRRAGVSSFGFGGTNAHILLEEAPEQQRKKGRKNSYPYYLICLSAKTAEALKAKQIALAAWLKQDEEQESLLDISATLLVGREHFGVRSALVVSSNEELRQKLARIIAGEDAEGCYVGQEDVHTTVKDSTAIHVRKGISSKGNSSAAYRDKLIKLAERYVEGEHWDTAALFEHTAYKRLALPTYPFAKERYWLPRPVQANEAQHSTTLLELPKHDFLHPYLHRNTSNLQEHRYSSIWSGQEGGLLTAISECPSSGSSFSALSCLEMARAALSLSDTTAARKAESFYIRLHDVIWPESISADTEQHEVHTALVPLADGDIGYEIYRDAPANGQDSIYCQGQVQWLSHTAAEKEASLVVTELGLSWKVLSIPANMPYIKAAYHQDGKHLARIQLPSINTTTDSIMLHPELLEAAIESAVESDIALSGQFTWRGGGLPMALHELDIYGACTSDMWVMVQRQVKDEQDDLLEIDMLLYDSEGTCQLAVKGLQVNLLKVEQTLEEELETAETREWNCLQKRWVPQPLVKEREYDGAIAVLTSPATEHIALILSRKLPKHQVVLLRESASPVQAGQQDQASDTFRAWIDVTGCGPWAETDHTWDGITLLQQAVEQSREKGLILLGVTQGLEALQNESIHRAGAARAALCRMLQSEYRHLISRHVDVDVLATAEHIADIIAAELEAGGEAAEVCYRQNVRYKAELQAIESVRAAGLGANAQLDPARNGVDEISRTLAFAEEEVLWITGGTRGLGYLCARHYVEQHGVKRLVLTGREELPPRELWDTELPATTKAKIDAICELEELGAQVKVLALPLSERELVEQHVQAIRAEWGSIAGVIHCAGSWDLDNPAFIRKPLDVFLQVAEPKTTGFEVLLASLRAEPLRFFVLFSSVSAIIPTLGAGRSDYAMANAYLDYAAEAYHATCPIVSIQWPSWKETGLGEVRNKAYDDTGLYSLTNQEGLHWLDTIVSSGIGPVVMPVVMQPDKWNPARLLDRYMVDASARSDEKAIKMALPHTESSLTQESDTDLLKQTEAWLTALLAKELKTEPTKLASHVPFQEFGIDSIMLAQIVRQMDRSLHGVAVDPAAFIEQGTIGSMTQYLIEHHREALIANTTTNIQAPSNLHKDIKPNITAHKDLKTDMNIRSEMGTSTKKTVNSIRQLSLPSASQRAAANRDKIAVIGMACHFPEASNLAAYWENLRIGKDSIGEVPLSRWNWRDYYDPSGHQAGKSLSKWGAFLEQIEYFDPSYFHISEALAEQIDPLQRQWLEVSAEALADAGFGKRDLWGKRVGVFTGTRTSNFGSKYCATSKDVLVATGQNFIAAHLSHIYNFKGPNMVVDAACASSLTAIHLAVRSIQSGEAEMALAGGVEILLDESMYLDLSAAKILSPEGRCRTFDSAANGVGLGEGCGVLVLKPLQAAIADGDKIYGVIDGTAINNDGNTMGVTTPNPEAQRELIEAAIEDGGIHPDTITYVEAHGTGTLIGDPIELKALTQVFGKYTSNKQYCGVGSVKTNLGHLLSAAGAASIIKVLLSMTAGQLPPTLNCSHPNPRFNFDDSPFYLVREARSWQTEKHVLRAGISSFGLGGNNAHIIVSNEGIPESLRATLVPKGDRVTFNRRRFWPQPLLVEQELHRGQETVEEDAFAGFFEPVQITR
ncbi:type I polyketide synthase [Paenibacillus sp. UMB4589-SE434]|uniref:type I polyketide synthase n=1 Tax=Paenibacillus sp. UMB4589-SE434 TaxID=3046314 RepID=UPI00254B454C|nr:type I polyketide synthase [Paenibacillus sp. UMB4589-SE434]MDK8181876.1 type I polyketide synthase [Paenibacillus sp. UMB4589-SE434]